MLNMNYDIQLGKYKVAHLLSCEVRKSAGKLSDTATIKLTGMAYGKALAVESKIKRGDEVNIRLGYNENLQQEFQGFISSITTDNTIVIECEDGMFLMRKPVSNKQYKQIEAAAVVEDVAGQIGGFSVVKGAGVSDVKYDKFTISNATAYEVFEKIKSDTGLHIFVKGKTLHIHLKYTYKEGEVTFDFSHNVESSTLKYISAPDKKVQVEAVGIDRANKKTAVVVGTAGGDKITVHRYNISDRAALQAIALEEEKKHRYTGYEGDLTTWLFPYCTYGYSATVRDTDYPNRQGTYYVEAVTTAFSSGGGKRKTTLAVQLA